MDHLPLLILAALIVGMSKGGLASAAAVAVPLLALVMNPVQAAAILLPVYLVTDWVGVCLYRRNFSGRNLAILIPSMLLGVGIATLITPHTSEALLLLGTGMIGLWYCARSWLRSHGTTTSAASIPAGVFWGTITGITSFITHSGAPPAQAYLLPQRLPRLEFAGTIAIAFTIGNLAKLPGYWMIGALDRLDWALTAMLAAAGIVGTVLGRGIVGRLSEATYRRVIEFLLFTLSIILVGRSVLALVR